MAAVDILDDVETATGVLATAADTRPTRQPSAFAEFCAEAFGSGILTAS